MIASFYIAVGFAVLGFAYAPGIETLLALVFISLSTLPLLAFGLAEGVRTHLIPAPPGNSLYWTIVLLGIGNLGLVAQSAGHPVSDLLHLDGVLAIASSSTVARYLEGSSSGNPFVLSLSFFLLFRVGVSVGVVGKIRVLIAFAPLIAYSIVSTEKYPLFVGACFYFTGFLSSRRLLLAAPRLSYYAAVFGVAGSVVGAAALLSRGRDLDYATGALLHYVFAPFPAFGNWLLDNAFDSCCELGKFSFIGPLNSLGLAERVSGVFTDSYLINGKSTNIMTAWKFLVIDFSVVGPLVLCSLIGSMWFVFTSFGLTRAASALRIFAILAALLSLSVTPFVHNSVLLALMISVLSYTFLPRATFPSTRAYLPLLSGRVPVLRD